MEGRKGWLGTVYYEQQRTLNLQGFQDFEPGELVREESCQPQRQGVLEREEM